MRCPLILLIAFLMLPGEAAAQSPDILDKTIVLGARGEYQGQRIFIAQSGNIYAAGQRDPSGAEFTLGKTKTRFAKTDNRGNGLREVTTATLVGRMLTLTLRSTPIFYGKTLDSDSTTWRITFEGDGCSATWNGAATGPCRVETGNQIPQ